MRERIKHYRGDDFRYTFRMEQYVNPEDKSLGTQVIDLTGWTVVVESDPDLSFTSSPPDNTGLMTVSLPAADTEDPAVEVILADVKLTDTTGFSRTYVHLTLALVEQVA